MNFIAFHANGYGQLPSSVVGESPSMAVIEHELPVFVICHENPKMLGADVIEVLIGKWKRTFHPSELPITFEMGDAVQAFLEWLEEEPLGYLVPATQEPFVQLPIFDLGGAQ